MSVFVTELVKELSEAVQRECIIAFGKGQRAKVLMLLPYIEDPINIKPSLLHLAATHGFVDVTTELINKYGFSLECTDRNGWMPLHGAALMGHVDIVRLLVTVFECSPILETTEGETALLIASSGGCLDVVVFLISSFQCDVNAQRRKDGMNALHLACRGEHIDIVQYLTTASNADVNATDLVGNTPLHYCSDVNIMRYLISTCNADVSMTNHSGQTPLHRACASGVVEVVNYLIKEQHSDPQCCDKHGYTPLHQACWGNRVEVVSYLLSTGNVDPMMKTSNGVTAFELTDNYVIKGLFAPFEQCHISFPVESVSKVFHAGNSAVGKSSLAQVLVEHTHYATEHIFSSSEEVTGVKNFTAGIVPFYIQHPKAGNLMLYDFAGHPEFYSSHSAILGSIMKRIPGVFVVMVDLSKEREDIAKQLHYWLSFIENESVCAHGPSQVIIVGSHADVLAGNSSELERKTNLVQSIARRMIKMQKFLGFVPLDCRKLVSDDLDEYIALLTMGSKSVLANIPVISYYCHVLYAFLKTKLNVPALVLESLSVAILAENRPSLPPDMNVLVSFLITLNDKGLILFLKNEEELELSWIIVNQEVILREVCGKLFAPLGFEEHQEISSNTGVVPLSVLTEVFPDHKPTMLLGFLKFFDFCQEIDSAFLQGTISNIGGDLHPLLEKSRLLFFPALVSAHRPKVCRLECSKNTIIAFGWCLGCNDSCHFFTPRFLHLLQLQIAFSFTRAKRRAPNYLSVNGLHRRCEVWKNGIQWENNHGIITSVELVDQSRCIQLVMMAEKASVVEFVRLRSAVINLVLDLQHELCPTLDTYESLISPSQLHTNPLPALGELVLFNIEDVSESIVRQWHYVPADCGKPSQVRMQDLLPFEPYKLLDPLLTSLLFDITKSNDRVPESVFHDIQKQLGELSCLVSAGDHHSLQRMLNVGSIYAGRSPLMLAQMESFPTKPAIEHVHLPTNKVLGTRDLGDVFFATANVNQWFSLGLALGLHYTTLEKIEMEKEKVDDCRRQMLVAWLQQKDDVVEKALPTWKTLESALRRIEENVIADKILREYCSLAS